MVNKSLGVGGGRMGESSDLTSEMAVLKFGLVGGWNEEDVPSDLIASRVREAALCFDNMKNMNNERKRLMKPGTETEAVAAGQGRAVTRVCLGKGGQAVGKRTGFAHLARCLTRLGPDNSTQVVDFPRMYEVRVFYERSRQPDQGQGNDWQRNRANGQFDRATGRDCCEGLFAKLCGKITACYAKVREVSRKFTKFRTDQARKSAMLRIVTGGTNFRREFR